MLRDPKHRQGSGAGEGGRSGSVIDPDRKRTDGDRSRGDRPDIDPMPIHPMPIHPMKIEPQRSNR
jgi:hypothetical protein